MTSAARVRLALALVFLGTTAILVRAAWVSDDAYISLRVLDNALHGMGPRWNALERVQVYTHPLWLAFLAIPYAVTRESLWTVALVGITTTLLAIAILARRITRLGTPAQAVALVAACALSRSVVSYASSGLENPLALLLLALLVERCDDERPPAPLAVVLLSSLVALTRIDLVLVAAPLAFAQLRRTSGRTAVRALAIGGLPFLAWEAFSLVYYGALVPNTALAKLGAGIAHVVLAKQGLRYYVALFSWDALGAAVLAIGLVVGFVRRRPLALGLLFYLGYIVWIGGDFMCGRFFMVPIVLAAVLAAEAPWPRSAWWAVAALPALLVLPVLDMNQVDWLLARKLPVHYWGVIDERVFYSPYTGVLDGRRPRSAAEQKFAKAGLDARRLGVLVESCVGMVGYYAGRGVEIIDPMALGDPLLARLPVDDPLHFRIGHFLRGLPEGYLTSVYSGKNEIDDPDLKVFWAAVERVTRGPIWAADRWRAIWALQTGRLDPLRDAYVARRLARLRAAASGSTAR